MDKVYVKYRGKKTYFQIPKDWNLLTFAEFADHPPTDDVKQVVRNALDNPIGSATLQESLSASDSIAILVEDLTRASPKKYVLGALLEKLAEISIPKSQISIIMALGTHRGLSDEELKGAFGSEIFNNYEFINHDCKSSDLVSVGKLKTGREVKINSRAYHADFKIGIGSIFPHPLNGFGGGGKILFPGVADFDSILEHHLKYSLRHGSKLGITDGNLFYEEVITHAASAKLDFIINSVLDHNDYLFDVVAGDPLKAHQGGIQICKKIISKDFKRKADLTVISAFPYSEGNQIMKPLAPANLITKKGGCIILVADCTVPLTTEYLAGCESFRAAHSQNLKQAVLSHFDNNQRILPDGAPELNMSMAQALTGQNDYTIILVTEDIGKEQVNRIGFQYAPDLQTSFEMAAEICPHPDVHVVPSGGVILPVLPSE